MVRRGDKSPFQALYVGPVGLHHNHGHDSSFPETARLPRLLNTQAMLSQGQKTQQILRTKRRISCRMIMEGFQKCARCGAV